MTRSGRKKNSAQHGFTLLEMLIAMLLTALVGLVLFSAYRNVSESRRGAARLVESQEHPRVFRAVLDDDFNSLFTQFDKRLPLLSRNRIEPGDAYFEAAGEKPELKEYEDEELLFSFAGTSGLAPDASPPMGLYCIEYVLRRKTTGYALVRRERAYCGVDGIFPWDEYIMLPKVYRLTTDVQPAGLKEFIADWQGMQSSEDLPQAVRFRIWHTSEDRFPETLIIRLPPKYTAISPARQADAR